MVTIFNKFLNLQEPDAAAMRHVHAVFVRVLPAFPEREFKGRGIVMIVGGRYAKYASISLDMLRLLGSRLPVEVWLKDVAEKEVGWCDDLVCDGVVCRYLADYLSKYTALVNIWSLKVIIL